jgi:hypothetical protein
MDAGDIGAHGTHDLGERHDGGEHAKSEGDLSQEDREGEPPVRAGWLYAC